MEETLEEAAKNYVDYCACNISGDEDLADADKRGFIYGAKWQADKMYSEEDMREAHFQGWVTRERFDDLSPDIIYPKGLDYEEKREYAFNLWFNKFKKK